MTEIKQAQGTPPDTKLAGETGGTTFIHTLGRPKLYDLAKTRIKNLMPSWGVRFVQCVTRPYVLLKVSANCRRSIRKKLSPELSRSFEQMLMCARQRWDRGEHEPLGPSIELALPGSNHRVSLRPGTCDIILYYDIFIQEHYGRSHVQDVHTVIDCGANIGLASVFLLSRYPQARLIALEPDPVNYELCRANLAQFGDRATVLKMGLWGTSRALAVNAANVGTWASVVAPAVDGASGSTVDGIDMGSLLEKHGIKTVDMLKIDIEGAELGVFTAPDLRWVDRVRCIQLEPEDDTCLQAFLKALKGKPYRLCQYREIVIAVRED